MPLYDYVCESCGHVVEVMHAISASGPTTCERCGGAMKRALSTPAIVFKGSGWAKKDARDASRSKSAAKPADATTGADATSPSAPGADLGGAGAAATSSSGSPDGGKASTTAPAAATSAGTSGGSGSTSG